MTKGLKFDTGKERYDLLPPEALHDIAKVLTYGAAKYAPNNWKLVDDPESRYFAAVQRHLWAWQRGEKLDPETNVSHLAHAACSIMFLLELENELK